MATLQKSWSRQHWLLALLPGTYFGLSNFFQNLIVVENMPAPGSTLIFFVSFILIFNLSALAFLGSWKLFEYMGGVSQFGLAQTIMQSLWIGISSIAHLAVISLLTTIIREPVNWRHDYALYFEEIVVTCLPIWLIVFGCVMTGVIWLSRDEETQPKKLEFREAGKRIYLDSGQVSVAQSEGNYVRLVADGTEHYLRLSLSALQKRLPASEFTQVHRGALARISEIVRIERTSTGAYRAILKNGQELPVSRRRLKNIRGKMA
ncbi:MAG: hypothetical protein Pars2KO_13490 [Parasphingorhabdus sp.]